MPVTDKKRKRRKAKKKKEVTVEETSDKEVVPKDSKEIHAETQALFKKIMT